MPNYGGSPTLRNGADRQLDIPIGAVLPSAAFVGSAIPDGWLLCDGASVSTTLYPALFAIMQYGHGGSGANFNLPDYRGRFQRGHQTMDGRSISSSLDFGPRSAQAAGGTAAGNGSVENFAMQGHWHEFWCMGSSCDNQSSDLYNAGPVSARPTRLGDMLSDGVSGAPRVSSETRAVNSAVLYYVRAF
jgi:phage-related tail fiber protein